MLEWGKHVAQCETDVKDVSKFFYIIDGTMLFQRLKCQTAKIKMDYSFSPFRNCNFLFW
jgi:hypothetical protein